jgi:hypothetical protein
LRALLKLRLYTKEREGEENMAVDDAGHEEEKIIELVVSVQQAGNERGKRIYFDSKSIEEIKEKCGDDFFLFNERILLAFVNSSDGKITLTSLKGVYKNYL